METWSLFGKAELVALEFFQTSEAYPHSKTPEKIKKFFSEHDHHLDFIILEGSLKADLLKSGIFTPEQALFLQENPIGKQAFCQCAEFFMNGFKLGHTALDLNVHKYIVPLDPAKPFKALASSVVLYPQSYAELYSLESSIAQCFKSCFSVEGDTISGITLWNVSYKGGGE